MPGFEVKIDPPLPETPARRPFRSLQEITPRAEYYDGDNSYDVRYLVDGREFTYYPASILTALNDVATEWELSVSRTSHDITLSGYTVLEVIFCGDDAKFYDPVERAKVPDAAPVAVIDASEVELAFKKALDSLWSQLSKIDDQRG